jgi:DNA-binding GntR family transcriptional regulator
MSTACDATPLYDVTWGRAAGRVLMTSITRLPEVQSLREQIERTLATRIVTGELAPGTVVTAPSLAADFGVSATPVREAMLNLTRRGFLTTIRNRGFRVTEVSLDELRELGAVRVLLEAPPMRDLAGHLSATVVQRMRALADEIVAAAREGRFEDYLAADTDFHLGLLEQTENRHLVAVVRELRQQTRLVGLTGLADSDELGDSALEHTQLIDLLEAGRGLDAEELMRRHISHVAGLWSGRAED